MSNIPAVQRLYPSSQAPGAIIQSINFKPFWRMTNRGAINRILKPTDKAFYAMTVTPTARAVWSQDNIYGLPSCDYSVSQIQTPVIRIGNQATWTPEDNELAGEYNIPHADLLMAIQMQGLSEFMARVMFYGINSTTGIFNTGQLMAGNLPPDSLGNSTILTYNAASLFQYFQTKFAEIKAAMRNNVDSIVVYTSTRIWTQIVTAKIVSLTSYQIAGAGTATVVEASSNIEGSLGMKLYFACDDNMQGVNGNANTDYIVISAVSTTPSDTLGIMKGGDSEWNTNEAAMRYNKQNTLSPIEMMGAGGPIKRVMPAMQGIMSYLFQTISPGWVTVSPTASTSPSSLGYIISAQYQ